MAFAKRKDFSDKTPEECNEAALARVFRSLSAVEQSSKKLRTKMEHEGYPECSIEYALNRATDLGVLSDERYCNILVRSTIASGKGISACLREVESLGIDPYELDSYQEYLENGDNAEKERALDYLERHPSRAKDVKGAAYRKLISKGYSSSIAAQAATEYFNRLSR